MEPETDAATRATGPTSGPARGRPSIVDASAVAEAAFRLWSERGFAATGWKELAEATGVSVRTLMRHYGTRDRIAWAEVEAAIDRFASAASRIADDVTVTEAVRTVVLASVTHDAHARGSAALWIRLIASESELIATGAAAERSWTARLTEFLEQRMPGAPREACRALAAAYEAATFAAISSWAEAGAHGEPADAVEQALRWIEISPPARG